MPTAALSSCHSAHVRRRQVSHIAHPLRRSCQSSPGVSPLFRYIIAVGEQRGRKAQRMRASCCLNHWVLCQFTRAFQQESRINAGPSCSRDSAEDATFFGHIFKVSLRRNPTSPLLLMLPPETDTPFGSCNGDVHHSSVRDLDQVCLLVVCLACFDVPNLPVRNPFPVSVGSRTTWTLALSASATRRRVASEWPA